MMATSIGPGTAAMDEKPGTPCTAGRFGLMG
jgi:hypothetical protein